MATQKFRDEATNNRNSTGRAIHAVAFSGGQGLLHSAFAAHQELLLFGANLMQHQLDTGRKLVDARNLPEMASAWNEFFEGAAQEFTDVMRRLLEYNSDVSRTVAQNSKQGFQELIRSFAGAIDEATEQVSNAVEATANNGRRAAEMTAKPATRRQAKAESDEAS